MNYQTSEGFNLTAAQIARLDEIEARVGDSVDAPAAPAANWTKAVRGKHAKRVQGTAPLRLPSVAPS